MMTIPALSSTFCVKNTISEHFIRAIFHTPNPAKTRVVTAIPVILPRFSGIPLLIPPPHGERDLVIGAELIITEDVFRSQ